MLEGHLFLDQIRAKYASGQSKVLTLFTGGGPFALGVMKSQLRPIPESQVRRIKLEEMTQAEEKLGRFSVISEQEWSGRERGRQTPLARSQGTGCSAGHLSPLQASGSSSTKQGAKSGDPQALSASGVKDEVVHVVCALEPATAEFPARHCPCLYHLGKRLTSSALISSTLKGEK